MKGGEGEIGLERLIRQGGEKMESGGLGDLGNSGQTIGGHSEGATGEKLGSTEKQRSYFRFRIQI